MATTLSDVFDRQYDMENSAFLLDCLEDLGILKHGDKFKLHVVIAVQEMLRGISYNEPFEMWTLSQTIRKLAHADFDVVDQVPKRKLNKVLRDIDRMTSNDNL